MGPEEIKSLNLEVQRLQKQYPNVTIQIVDMSCINGNQNYGRVGEETEFNTKT